MLFFHALFVADRCTVRYIISNCNAGSTCMNSGIMLTYSYVSETDSRLLAFNSVTQKYADCNYIMNFDQRCEHKNLKCDKQIKECN